MGLCFRLLAFLVYENAGKQSLHKGYNKLLRKNLTVIQVCPWHHKCLLQ